MKRVVVDTSVWVDHFRYPNAALTALLGLDMAFVHPMIVGEVACGTPPARTRTLKDLALLQQTEHANLREVMDFIEREKLFGTGCGLVDVIILASTLMTPGAELWTLDKRLATLAARFGAAYNPTLH